jgi:hypothetical protein
MAKSEKKQKFKQIQIDWTVFEELCAIQCTLAEIAGFFKCSIDTIELRVKEKYGAKFSDVYDIYRAPGFISLRRSMWRNAVAKYDTQMQKHLSKNYLGMSEKVDQKIEMNGQIQTSSMNMDDVKKMMGDPVAKKLSLELANRMLELNGETPDEN